jgi:hypothetical protein
MHPSAGALQNESHGPQNIERFWQASLGDYFSGDSGLVYDSVGAGEQPGPRRWILSLPSFAREPPGLVETLSHRTRWCGLEHDPEKWVPVFRKDHAQTKRWSGMTIRRKVIRL